MGLARVRLAWGFLLHAGGKEIPMWLKENWFKITVLILIVVISSAFYFKNGGTKEEATLSASETKRADTGITQETTNAGVDIPIKPNTDNLNSIKKETSIPKQTPETPAPITPKEEDLVLVLINYKIDAGALSKDTSDLLTNSYNYAQYSCPNIIQTRVARNNAYYSYLDSVTYLHNKYDKYKDKILYINNNLNGFDGVIQTVKDKCSSLGYSI